MPEECRQGALKWYRLESFSVLLIDTFACPNY